MSDTNSYLRGRAAIELGNLGPHGRAVLPQLRQMLTESNNYARYAAAQAIWTLNREPAEVVPALISVLDENIHMGFAMDVLGEVGPDAKAAIPALKRCLCSTHNGNAAARALAKIDPKNYKEYANETQNGRLDGLHID